MYYIEHKITICIVILSILYICQHCHLHFFKRHLLHPSVTIFNSIYAVMQRTGNYTAYDQKPTLAESYYSADDYNPQRNHFSSGEEDIEVDCKLHVVCVKD